MISMFVQEASPPPAPNVNVTVNAANAAESAKLLRDLEKEAQDRIDAAFRVGSNGFDCTVYVCREYMSLSYNISTIYQLNGKQIKTAVSVDELDTSRPGIRPIDVIVGRLIEEMSADITREIVHPALMKVNWNVAGLTTLFRKN